MDFGEFELEEEARKEEAKGEPEPSLAELQKIYFKHDRKKKKRELEQISLHNRNSSNTQENSQPNPQKLPSLQSHKLLNQTEKSFKTVSKLYIELSCLVHLVSLFIAFLLAEWKIYFKIVFALVQLVCITGNVLHLVEGVEGKIKGIGKRSRLLGLQIGAVGLADLAIAGMLLTDFGLIYFVVVAFGIDIGLVIKLHRLYKIQVIMDAEPPGLPSDEPQSMSQQFDLN